VVVEVDEGGSPVANVTVTFTATNATVTSSSVQTDASGRAQTPVQLGSTVGAATVTASAAGVTTPVIFTAAVTNTPGPGAIAVTSAASFAAPPVAPGMIAVIWSQTGSPDFTTVTQHAPSQPLPTSMGGVSVKILDSGGTSRDVSLIDVSPKQLNVVIPDGTQGGAATITVNRADGQVSTGTVVIESVAPGLFSATSDGKGKAVGQAIRVAADGSFTTTDLSVPIDMGQATDKTILVIYGTGIRGRTSLVNVNATVGGQTTVVDYAGAQGTFAGLDQVNLELPRSLRGQGDVSISLTVDGKTANALTVSMAALPPVGSIQVATNLSAASFAISGPANYSGSGTTWTTTNAPVGDYTITYGALAGYATPSAQTKTLGAGGTIAFTATYVPLPGPGIASISPTSGQPGQTISNFTINGTNLTGGQVVWDNQDGLTLSNLTVTATSVQGTLAIASSAALGARWLWVVTSAGASNHLAFTLTGPLPNITSGPSLTTVSPGGIVTWQFKGTLLAQVNQLACTPNTGIAVDPFTPTDTQIDLTIRVAADAPPTERICNLTAPGDWKSSDYHLNVSTFRISNLRVSAENPGTTLRLHVTVDYTDPTGAVSSGSLSAIELLTFSGTLKGDNYTITPTGRTPGATSGTMAYDTAFANISGTTGAIYYVELVAPDGRKSDTLSRSF
jgi:uncharacterized protein (TIGR03437 family)